MSPSESIEAWKSLQEVKPDELPYELEARANQDFPALWQLESSIQGTISSLFKSNQHFSNSCNGIKILVSYFFFLILRLSL